MAINGSAGYGSSWSPIINGLHGSWGLDPDPIKILGLHVLNVMLPEVNNFQGPCLPEINNFQGPDVNNFQGP